MNRSIDLPSRYKIISSLGKGGMGEVYKVHDSLLDKDLALKVLHATKAKARASLIQEFKTLAKLNHHNLIRVYDLGFLPKNIPYFTMELIDGVDLHNFFKEPKNLHYINPIIKQIFSAIIYLHSKNIIHGDIKPQNILVTKTDSDSIVIKLLDFGLVTKLNKNVKKIRGTLRFISPEIITSSEYSNKSDLYALGLSLIESITQQEIPISSKLTDNYYRSIYRLLDDIMRKADIRSHSSISSFLLNLSQIDPKDRPPSANTALQSFLPLSKEVNDVPSAILDDVVIDKKAEIDIINNFLNKKHSKCILVLEGLKGIGKKCLLTKAIHIAQLSNYLVIDLTKETDKHRSLDHFLHALALNLSQSKKNELLASHSKIISTYISQQRSINPHDQTAQIIYNNIIRFIRELSKSKSILICIPDIELLSQNLLSFVNQLKHEIEIHHPNIYLLLTRNTNINLNKNAFHTFNDIITSSFSNRQAVKPFNNANLKNLLLEAFGKDIFSQLERNRILEYTQGIPLIIKEFIKYLILQKVIKWENDKWVVDHKTFNYARLPKSIQDISESRIAELSANEKALIQIMAFWGESLHAKQLYRIASKRNSHANHSIKVLLKNSVIFKSNGSLLNLDKSILRQYIISNTPKKKRLEINRAILDELEFMRSTDHLRIARHAIYADDYNKAMHHGFKAADQLVLQYELNDCLALLTDIKKLVSKLGDEADIAEVIEKYAPVAYRSGLSQEAAENYRYLIDHTKDYNKKANYLIQLASIYEDLWGQMTEASNLYIKALSQARKATNEELIARIYIKLGMIAGYKSADMFYKAIKLAENKNINIYGSALAQLIYCNKMSGNIAEMQNALENALKILDEVDINTQKEILFNAYSAYFYMGNYKEAKSLIKDKIKIEENTNDIFSKIRSLSSLGGCYYVEGKFYNTIEILMEALLLAKRYGDHLMSITILSNLSLAYRRLADYGNALNAISEADDLIRMHNISEVSSYYLTKPTHLYLMLGKAFEDDYYKYLKRTLRRATKVNNLIVLGHRKLIISLFHYYNMKYGQAIRFGKEALKYFKESDDKDDIVETLGYLCIYSVYNSMSKKAFEYLIEAKAIIEEIHCEYLKPLIYFAEAILARETERDDIEELFILALKASSMYGTKEVTWQIQRELSLYFNQVNNLQKSLAYYRDAISTLKQISESIENSNLELSYLSVPLRKRVFTEIKALSQDKMQ